MRPPWAVAAALCVSVLAGCAPGVALSKAENPLDRAIRYTEMPTRGSAVDASSSAAFGFGVPRDAEVDTNSSIKISLQKDAVDLPSQPLASESSVVEMQRKSEKLRGVLEALAKVVEGREKKLAAYREMKEASAGRETPQFKAFVALKKASSLEEDKLLEAAQDLFHSGTFSIGVVEFDKLFDDNTYRAFGAFLQGELNSAETAWKDTQERVKRRALSLRLEAYLEKPKGDPVAIHIDKYDSLDQREAKFKDSYVLDKDDWTAFRQQYQETVGLARQAEAIRKGEGSLAEKLKQTGVESLRNLVALGEEAEPYFREDWRAEGRGLIQDLAAAQDAVENVLTKDYAENVAKVTASLNATRKAAAAVGVLNEIPPLLKDIRGLSAEWQRVNPDSLMELVDKTNGTIKNTADITGKVDRTQFSAFQVALGSSAALLQELSKQLPENVWSQVQAELERRDVSARLEGWLARGRAFHSLVERLKNELDRLAIKPAMTNLRVPEAKEVSWAEAPDATIDLQRTPRSIDDRLHVSATLKMGEQEYLKSHAVFKVTQFGWHATLAPSVILAKPLHSTSAFDRDFKFAPAVAWLHTYSPRDTERGPMSSLARFSQGGIGLHASFIDFDPQKDAEIGLGGAVSVWHDRIVAGIGWNLMNNSRAYFYIGSNLIPVLQALGFGKEGSAGKQP